MAEEEALEWRVDAEEAETQSRVAQDAATAKAKVEKESNCTLDRVRVEESPLVVSSQETQQDK